MKRLTFFACSHLPVLSVSAAQAGDVTPPAPITPAATPVEINTGAGGQTDSHISSTLISYRIAFDLR